MFCSICPIKSKPVELDVTKEATLRFEASDARWARVEFCWDRLSQTYMQDVTTGELYNDDGAWCVRIKCIALIPSTLLISLVRMVEHVVKRGFSDLLQVPYYGLMCVKAAFIGIIDPFEGRRAYGLYERTYFGNPERVDKKRDFFLAPCFQPINCNVVNKHDSAITLSLLKCRVLKPTIR